MIVRSAVIFLLSLYAYSLTLRHNMHMFQQNGYKNDEHIRWLKKNIR